MSNKKRDLWTNLNLFLLGGILACLAYAFVKMFVVETGEPAKSILAAILLLLGMMFVSSGITILVVTPYIKEDCIELKKQLDTQKKQLRELEKAIKVINLSRLEH